MPLQGSGNLSISEIKAEQGNSSNSLKQMGLDAGFTVPFNMSQFYGYSSYSNSYYHSFGATTYGANFYKYNAGTRFLPTYNGKFSVSFWVKNNLPVNQNWTFFDIVPSGAASNNNRLFFSYAYVSNRLTARYRSNAVNFDCNWDLHSGLNATATGITALATGWNNAQQGYTNAAGFVHIVMTYDGTQTTGANAFKLYWNGVQVPVVSTSANGARVNMSLNDFRWGQNWSYNQRTDGFSYDEICVYDTVLSGTQVNSIYNGGTPVDSAHHGITAGLQFEVDMESTTPTDGVGIYNLFSNNTTRTAY